MKATFSKERISVFDIFKIGVGPSSSHTMGPWRAAQRFLKSLEEEGALDRVRRLVIRLYGSLAKTGKGHGTDVAILLGLSGEDPVSIDPQKIDAKILGINSRRQLLLGKDCLLDFDYDRDIIFHYEESLAEHPNGMILEAQLAGQKSLQKTYFSVGGGFITEKGEIKNSEKEGNLFCPVNEAGDLLHWSRTHQLDIWEIVLKNEQYWRSEISIRDGLLKIWEVMRDCAFLGCHTEGELPGGLKVSRRAFKMHRKLIKELSYSGAADWLETIRGHQKEFREVNKWISCFALAINEQNASFGRVVTAPTNGAAGVIPAVLLYYYCFCEEVSQDDIIRFLLTAGELGSIFKKGATISAALGGCQAEIGVSSAMAAGALTERLGGSPEQVLMAAEIAMEHHLGLTCDPIGGLVQIPCIERNTMGAIKAITASNIALESDPNEAKVSLDDVIRTMWQTALDMNEKYKETSEGGLAAHISINVVEC